MYDLIKVDELTSRRVLQYGEQLMVVEVIFTGTHPEITLHSHEHEQIAYVLEGTFEFLVIDKLLIVKEGDSIFLESSIMHGARCISKSGRILDSFSPIRKDYLVK